MDGIASGSANLLDRRLRAPVLFCGAVSADKIAAMHFHMPSIDPGVMAFVWSLLLAVFIYFGLLAVGASAAFAIVVTLVSFAAMWLFIRLRGEDGPVV